MNKSPDTPRISSIPPSYLKKRVISQQIKEETFNGPSPGIFFVLLRNMSFCEHDQLKVKFCREILNRLEVWNDLAEAVQEKIRPEIMDFLNKLKLPGKTEKHNLSLIIEEILRLATEAEYELGVRVDVEIKNDREAREYDSLLNLLDYCRGKINRITGSDSIFPESEIPTRREPVPG